MYLYLHASKHDAVCRCITAWRESGLASALRDLKSRGSSSSLVHGQTTAGRHTQFPNSYRHAST
jgi:hypothetical protein